MPVTHQGVTLHLGPRQVGAPDDLEAAIVDFIDGAERELRVAVQEIDHPPIAEAILRAKRRGVRLMDVVLEADYLREPKAPPAGKDGAHHGNRLLANAMLREAIDVKADFNPSIFHQKFIVRDGTAVLTGSTNFTTTGVTQNLNHVVVIEDRTVAQEFRREFLEINRGIFGRLSDAHGRAPKEARVGGLRIKPLFAPEHAPEMEIMKMMAKARSRVDFAIFTFAQSSGIDDQMIATVQRGVTVRGVLDGKQANHAWAASKGLHAAGVQLHRPRRRGSGIRKVHHKLMVIDGEVVVTGSFNYTGPANSVNDENILIIGTADDADPAGRAAQMRFGAAALGEIERMIHDHCEPFTPRP
ncbi:MAG: phospholipase D-like domain-containing protein [Pseudomonadota bacterium]